VIEVIPGTWRIYLQTYYDALKWKIIEINLSHVKDRQAMTVEFRHQLVLRWPLLQQLEIRLMGNYPHESQHEN
jgi:hypothetical protein